MQKIGKTLDIGRRNSPVVTGDKMSGRKGSGNMYPSEKMVNFAKMIADETGADIPGDVINSMPELKQWIDEQSATMPHDEEGKLIFKPSMSQISFAEKIAQSAGLDIPNECYQNKKEMSRWIDENKSHLPSGRATDKMVALSRKIYDFCIKEGKEVPDPAGLENDFEGMKNWLDANYPAEWRRA